MTKPLWDEKIPFDNQGNLVSVLDTYKGDLIWRRRFIFEDELEVIDWVKGSSSIQLILRSINTNKNYPMFQFDVLRMLQKSVINKGRIKGLWSFKKRGTSYGLYFSSEVSDEDDLI